MAGAPRIDSLILPEKARSARDSRDSSLGLPTDVLSQSAVRLRVLALLYAFVFLMAAYLPALLLPAERGRMFSTFVLWAPGLIAIAVALLVAFFIRSPRVPLRAVTPIALIFEVVGSYGIAAAEFLDPLAIRAELPGRLHPNG